MARQLEFLGRSAADRLSPGAAPRADFLSPRAACRGSALGGLRRLRLRQRARRPGRRSIWRDRFRARWRHGGRCCMGRGRCCMGRGRCCMGRGRCCVARGRCCMGRGRRDGRLRMGRLRRGCRCRVGHRNHHDGSGDDPRGRLRGNMRRGSRRRRSGSHGHTSRGRRRHWGRGRSSRGRHWDLGRRRLVVVDHGWQPQWCNPRDQLVADDSGAGCCRPARVQGLDGAGPCECVGDEEARREEGESRWHRQDTRPVPRARRPMLAPHASNRISPSWCSRFIPWSPSLSAVASRY